MSTVDAEAHPLAPPNACGGVDRVTWLAERIAGEIVEGRLKPGEKLNEPSLSRRYGVSRAPLREAIGRLEGRRLVVRRPNQGARVVSLEPSEFLEMLHAREGLEGISARLAASRIEPSELASLEAICARQAATELNTPEAIALDMSFHLRISRASRNYFIASTLCEEFFIVYRITRRLYTIFKQREINSISEHVKICEAVAARDGDLAEFLMRHHIAGARRSFETAIQQDRSA